MKVKDFINQLEQNLDLDAELNFLFVDYTEWFWLDIEHICMNADVDDPKNKNQGGIVLRKKTNN